jgi:hypothetical protein
MHELFGPLNSLHTLSLVPAPYALAQERDDAWLHIGRNMTHTRVCES